jgi:hypothetical protein
MSLLGHVTPAVTPRTDVLALCRSYHACTAAGSRLRRPPALAPKACPRSGSVHHLLVLVHEESAQSFCNRPRCCQIKLSRSYGPARD